MNTEKEIVAHYARAGLADAVLSEARQGAADPARPTVAELGAYDEFHIGGRRATDHFMALLKPARGMKILDIGCGIGGAARFTAAAFGAEVTGIDLTPEFIETASALNGAVGMNGNPAFETGSALDLPFTDEIFGMAYTIHAAMNIADKAGMYREAARVLKLGAALGIYDIMAGSGDALQFPVPWSTVPETSFLATPVEIKNMLEAAGFEVTHEESRRDFALETFEKNKGQKPLPFRKGDFAQKVANLKANVEAGLCAPHIIIGRKK